MWLFLQKGFVSVVADRNDPTCLLVRGRFRGDIERLFPQADVRGTPEHDYPFRASIPREVVQERVAAEIGRIAYSNFKNAVPKKRAAIYLRIWSLLANAARPRAGRNRERRATWGEGDIELLNDGKSSGKPLVTPPEQRAAFEARLTYSRPGELRVDMSNATGPSMADEDEDQDQKKGDAENLSEGTDNPGH